jgi:pyrimidine-nucleoside phosphorylase
MSGETGKQTNMAQKLEQAAWQAQRGAYAPYSNFQVGAALETQDGQIVSGGNVENASLSLGLCAERVALFQALASGLKPGCRIVVATDTETPTPPCGACREVLRELAPLAEVVSVCSSGQRKTWAAGELLPPPVSRATEAKAGPRGTIMRKRDGETLSGDELHEFVLGLVNGDVTPYQMSAFMMAVYLKGMTTREIRDLTAAMLASGTRLDYSHLQGPKIDKHSTGGVGDRISIPLFPLALAAGLQVPMISGRGLGHTGGTLDKLDAIPGYRTQLPISSLKSLVPELGGFMAGQTSELVPADKIMYALRDVTGTVSTIPLIVGSILSKKLAAGLTGLVLDVKFGRGAFMPDLTQAEELARTLVTTAADLNLPSVALLTRMDEPIGETVGNALEVQESMRLLTDPEPAEDFRILTCVLTGLMTTIGGLTDTMAEGAELIEGKRRSGEGAEMARRWISAQGGDPAVVSTPELLAVSTRRQKITAQTDGYIQDVDALLAGELCVQLGGGRAKMDDVIDPRVGLVIQKRRGDAVRKGETLLELYLPEDKDGCAVAIAAEKVHSIAETKPAEKPLIAAMVTRRGTFDDPWQVPLREHLD